MKDFRTVRVLCHLARQSKGRGVEQSPRAVVAPVMRWVVVRVHHVTDAGQVDDTLAVHLHDCVIHHHVRQWQCLVPLVGQGLGLPCLAKRFDDFRHQPRQIALGVLGVSALDDVLG